MPKNEGEHIMLEALREQVSAACQMAFDYGLTSFTWGNVSGFDRANSLIVIKPKGVAYQNATPESLVISDLSGNIVEGDAPPSADIPAHIALYKAFGELGGIIHTHSPAATVWAQAGRDIPPYGVTHAEYFRGSIPCTRSLLPAEIDAGYEEQIGLTIAETFEKRGLDPLAIPGALVFNHGPFAWGADAQEAVKNAFVLEMVAKMAYQTERINPEIMPIEKAILDKQFEKRS